mmetsp:Transcript_23437/g.65048  ORF Transcript_23437/g.65048 Transcript_23437/m.65048 type:complete len:100 (-) Transcript_23437:896-1195(-)
MGLSVYNSLDELFLMILFCFVLFCFLCEVFEPVSFHEQYCRWLLNVLSQIAKAVCLFRIRFVVGMQHLFVLIERDGVGPRVWVLNCIEVIHTQPKVTEQ